MSQRLIHTRVYGQAIAVGATVAVMAILKAQEDRGGLPFGETAPQADTSNTLPRRFRDASESPRSANSTDTARGVPSTPSLPPLFCRRRLSPGCTRSPLRTTVSVGTRWPSLVSGTVYLTRSVRLLGRPSRALGDKGKDLYGRGIRDRDAWAEDNVGDKYGLKFTQARICTPHHQSESGLRPWNLRPTGTRLGDRADALHARLPAHFHLPAEPSDA